MAGRADFRIDLKAARQLTVVELAERPVPGELQRLRLLVELVGGERRGRVGEIARDSADQRDQQDPGEYQADEKTDEPDHVPACPLTRPLPLRLSRRAWLFAQRVQLPPAPREERNR